MIIVGLCRSDVSCVSDFTDLQRLLVKVLDMLFETSEVASLACRLDSSVLLVEFLNFKLARLDSDSDSRIDASDQINPFRQFVGRITTRLKRQPQSGDN